MLVTLLCLVSCNEKKQPTEYKEPVDVTLRDADGVPMGFHKGYDGVTYYDNDISAPKKGERSMTVQKFCEKHKKGKYVLTTAHHDLAVINGKYWDLCEDHGSKVYKYYELVEE